MLKWLEEHYKHDDFVSHVFNRASISAGSVDRTKSFSLTSSALSFTSFAKYINKDSCNLKLFIYLFIYGDYGASIFTPMAFAQC